MTIRRAIPYLILHGAALRAISFYEEALGAKPRTLQRFGDMDPTCPEAKKHLVMHAELQVGEALLMLSDGPGEGSQSAGGQVNVALDFSNHDELRRCFDTMATGGRVIQAPIEAPWGLFAALRDRFGVDWMFSADHEKAK